MRQKMNIVANGRILIIIIMAFVVMISTVSALPEILDIFNSKYHTEGTKLDTCDLCHIPDKPKRGLCDETCHIPNSNIPNNHIPNKPEKIANSSLNLYGMIVKENLNLSIDQDFAIIESLDSDGDRFSNIDEINNLTFPGDKTDFPRGKKDNSMNLLETLKNLIP